MNGLKLSLEDGTIIDDPSEVQIADALSSLKTDEISFAILELSSGTYMQTALQLAGRYIIEYQEGSLDNHFQAVAHNIGEVIAAFQAYARGDYAWWRQFAWVRIVL